MSGEPIGWRLFALRAVCYVYGVTGSEQRRLLSVDTFRVRGVPHRVCDAHLGRTSRPARVFVSFRPVHMCGCARPAAAGRRYVNLDLIGSGAAKRVPF